MFVLIIFLIFFVLIPGVIALSIAGKYYSGNLHDSHRYDRILMDNFAFYNTLDPFLQRKFRSRLSRFIDQHEFEGRENFSVTVESVVLISSAAIHLTLGLDDYEFPSFKKILIYPGIYVSPVTRTHNKGETNPHGVIAFSWPDIVEGFKTVKDHINLAYHEFSHALLLEHSADRISDSQFEGGYEMFCHALKEDHLSQRIKQLHIFRDYAFTNKMEFFAVAVENFLEAPRELYDNCHEMYNILKHMLRQDPVNHQYGIIFSYSDEFWNKYLS